MTDFKAAIKTIGWIIFATVMTLITEVAVVIITKDNSNWQPENAFHVIAMLALYFSIKGTRK